ncbi:30S ribosomal protein S6 [Candidatus Omnitrophota bacterium]
MKEYEALFVIDPDKESSLEQIAESIVGAITKNKGKVDNQANWGKQRLSHPIDKKQDGIYYKLNFSMDPTLVRTISNVYKLDSNILRVMITAK